MKKHYFLLLLSLLAAFSLHAQPTITSASFPAAGDTGTMATADTSIQAGPGGASMTWSFGSLTIQSTSHYAFSSAAATAAIDTFPTANILMTSGSNLEYSKISASSWMLVGLTNQSNIDDHLNQNYLNVPMAYNSTWNQNLSTYGINNTLYFNRIGPVSSDADAYGTLTTPAGTFTNVLRRKYTEAYSDSFPGLAGSHYNYIAYEWWKEGYCRPLLTILYSHTTTAGFPFYSKSVTFLRSGSHTSSVAEANVQTINFQVNPQPASSMVHLQWQGLSSRAEELQVIDLNGRLMKSIPLGTAEEYLLSLADLPAGEYFVSLRRNGRNLATRPLVVQ